MSEGWDWDAIERSDYPIVTWPAALRRDVVYCEFWAPMVDSGAYQYVTGLVIPWEQWLQVRETPVGNTLDIDLSAYGIDGSALYPFPRARFGIWTAFVNPRFPRHTVGVWSLEGGFHGR